MSGDALSIRDLRVGYGGIAAVKGISLEVARGEIVTLIGANGAGKTSTLKAIVGLVPAQSGEITLFGEPLRSVPTPRIVSRGVALVPEGRAIFGNLSVAENLELGAFSKREPVARAQRLDRVLKLFPRLAERMTQEGGTLSGGEQQMLAIGRALTLNPKVLLLDEPTEGLAPIIVEELLKALGTITRSGGICSIIVEQNAQKILGLADRVVILERGTIVHDAASHALKADPAVLERYLGVAGAAVH